MAVFKTVFICRGCSYNFIVKGGLLNAAVFKTVFIYVGCSYIVIVYRRVIECGCVYNSILCMYRVVILLFCTDRVLNVALYKTVFIFSCIYTVIVKRRFTDCGCV